jgi:hypothetical protein
MQEGLVGIRRIVAPVLVGFAEHRGAEPYVEKLVEALDREENLVVVSGRHAQRVPGAAE